jgi:amidohydrolase
MTGYPQRAATVLRGLDALLPPVEALYRDLHRFPELAGQEAQTARRLAEWLRRAGCEVSTGIGGHGVVGVLRNGAGPTVLLRAELDALAVRERTGLEYASTVTANGPDGSPVMHACGHDAHLACLAATAALLDAGRAAWGGTVLFVGQPAEETLAGAAAMVADGLYERYGRPDVALAQHVTPTPAGTVGHGAGALMAGSATLEVTIPGRGGHGAAPDLTIDPVVIAAAAVLRLQTVVSRQTNPFEPAVLTVGSLHAGGPANAVADRATLGVSLRGFTASRLDAMVDDVRRIVRAECAAAGCPTEPDVAVTARAPVNVNDVERAARVRDGHRAVLGPARVLDMPPSMASEDFPAFGLSGTVPTVYWYVGSVAAQRWRSAPGGTPQGKLRSLPANHSPEFAPDPSPTLRTGTAALVAAALSQLGAPELVR